MNKRIGMKFLPAVFAIACTVPMANAQQAETAIPVTFTQTVSVGHAKTGDVVLARTMQRVDLDGQSIPSGSLVKAHVVEAKSDAAASTLYIRFDSIRTQHGTIPLTATVRALANAREAEQAEIPQQYAENDPFPSRTLIGGGSYTPPSKTVLLGRADGPTVIGQVNGNDVVAPLQAGIDTQPASDGCAATTTPQSLGIFSPLACGSYGFESTHLVRHSGSDGLVMVSNRAYMKLYAKSAALLIVHEL